MTSTAAVNHSIFRACRGIEEIGVYIEEPFSLLPLEGLTKKLEVALSYMAADHKKIDSYLKE